VEQVVLFEPLAAATHVMAVNERERSGASVLVVNGCVAKTMALAVVDPPTVAKMSASVVKGDSKRSMCGIDF